jgi:hypothetical protein
MDCHRNQVVDADDSADQTDCRSGDRDSHEAERRLRALLERQSAWDCTIFVCCTISSSH